jgi:hypothetical protein
MRPVIRAPEQSPDSQQSSPPACTALNFATRTPGRVTQLLTAVPFENHGSTLPSSPASPSWLVPASRNGLSLAHNDCLSPDRHCEVKAPDLFLRCLTALSSNPFDLQLRRSSRSPDLGGFIVGARCPIPAPQSRPILGYPLPFGALSNPSGSTRSTRYLTGKHTFRLRPITSRSPLPFLLE